MLVFFGAKYYIFRDFDPLIFLPNFKILCAIFLPDPLFTIPDLDSPNIDYNFIMVKVDIS